MIVNTENNVITAPKRNIDRSLMIVIVSVAIVAFVGILSETGLNIAYSLLMNEFAVSASKIQWLTTGYLLTLAILIPISPTLIKNFKTKRLFQTAAIIFFMGTLCCALALNFEILLLGRIVQAIGTSISLPLIINIILEQAPLEQRGYLMGIVGLVTSFAPALGPVIGGIVVQWMNWHWIFIIMIPVLLVSFFLGSKYITDINFDEKMSIDFISVILSAIGFAGVVYGVSISGDTGWSDLRVRVCIIIGILSIGIFAYRQLHMESPLIHIIAFKYPMFTLGVGILMISMMSALSAGFLLPLLIQKSLGYSSMVAALAMLPGAVINGIMSPFTGKILDKHGPKVLLPIGFTLVIITLSIFSFASNTFVMIIIAYAIFMFGASMLAMPAQTNGLNELPQKYNADGTAIMNTLQQVSGAIGTAIASSILTNKSEIYVNQFSNATKDVISQSVAFGSQKAFVVFLILSIAGLILSLFARKN